LYAIPGSHKCGVNRHFKRKALPEIGTEFSPVESDSWSKDGEVPLECPAGTLVLIHNAVVHYSAANFSENARHAYSIHVVDGKPGVLYPSDNWLQRSDGSPFNKIKYSV
jgi:phytanoyl-CoA hydroxylase